ncbi:hypothetical protein PSTG_03968 [Puccinia striiformis f. sp. tritici PST-78]|uniref:Uncharacterized protein n=1 Tax=Puccinia striiformis f. sp. tritici PST-78 TaxID=1165861 RepID=A0A0L0VTZ3_9BASI|nr:hypothetical protein PSTG_03968 [Puccinia striiformis f. sp. tritici PST-78]
MSRRAGLSEPFTDLAGCPSRCSCFSNARTSPSDLLSDGQVRELLEQAGPTTHRTGLSAACRRPVGAMSPGSARSEESSQFNFRRPNSEIYPHVGFNGGVMKRQSKTTNSKQAIHSEP